MLYYLLYFIFNLQHVKKMVFSVLIIIKYNRDRGLKGSGLKCHGRDKERLIESQILTLPD